tara:strand:+ start:41 stop:301 length:261 start_codon:yes stop_codon:yes gene_type:complete
MINKENKMNTKYVCLTNGQFFEVHNNNWKQIKDKKKIKKKFFALLKIIKDRNKGIYKFNYKPIPKNVFYYSYSPAIIKEIEKSNGL